MKCNCLSDVEKKIAEFMERQAGPGVKVTAASTAFQLTDAGIQHVLQVPFRVKGSKKGYTSERGKEIGCNSSYCPFCGRSTTRYVVGEDAGIAAAMGIAPAPAEEGGAS